MARILIAEDDDAMREFLLHALTRSGHEVSALSSGDAAIQYAEAERFDLLLADVDMAGMDGVELARRADRKSVV